MACSRGDGERRERKLNPRRFRASVTVPGAKYAKHEVLKPNSLFCFLGYENLHCQSFLHIAFCKLQISADSAGHELRAKISGLRPHQVVLIYALAQPVGRSFRSTGTYGLARFHRVENTIRSR
jgi:hypothetical protein